MHNHVISPVLQAGVVVALKALADVKAERATAKIVEAIVLSLHRPDVAAKLLLQVRHAHNITPSTNSRGLDLGEVSVATYRPVWCITWPAMIAMHLAENTSYIQVCFGICRISCMAYAADGRRQTGSDDLCGHGHGAKGPARGACVCVLVVHQ